jgi:serine/threonine protein kinase
MKNQKGGRSQILGDYVVGQTLGKGTFGKVKLGVHMMNKNKVAVKILEKSRMKEKDDFERVLREMEIIKHFNNENVIGVYEILEDEQMYYIIMEFCPEGELFNYIVKKKRLTEEEAAFFFYQIINGLESIHSNKIVHRDLKPENLLLTKDKKLKIIDFGLSNFFEGDRSKLLSTPCGSPCYASPEMVAGKKYNGFMIDIWSTGIILFAMICGYLPFEDPDNEKLFMKILECNLIFPNYVPALTRDMIKRLLVTDPDKRIRITEIKKHEFYLLGKKVYYEELKKKEEVGGSKSKELKEPEKFVKNGNPPTSREEISSSGKKNVRTNSLHKKNRTGEKNSTLSVDIPNFMKATKNNKKNSGQSSNVANNNYTTSQNVNNLKTKLNLAATPSTTGDQSNPNSPSNLNFNNFLSFSQSPTNLISHPQTQAYLVTNEQVIDTKGNTNQYFSSKSDKKETYKNLNTKRNISLFSGTGNSQLNFNNFNLMPDGISSMSTKHKKHMVTFNSLTTNNFNPGRNESKNKKGIKNLSIVTTTPKTDYNKFSGSSFTPVNNITGRATFREKKDALSFNSVDFNSNLLPTSQKNANSIRMYDLHFTNSKRTKLPDENHTTRNSKYLPSINKLKVEKSSGPILRRLNNDSVESINKKTKNLYLNTDISEYNDLPNSKFKVNEFLNITSQGKFFPNNMSTNAQTSTHSHSNSIKNTKFTAYKISADKNFYTKDKMLNNTFVKIKEKVKDLYYQQYLNNVGVKS